MQRGGVWIEPADMTYEEIIQLQVYRPTKPIKRPAKPADPVKRPTDACKET